MLYAKYGNRNDNNCCLTSQQEGWLSFVKLKLVVETFSLKKISTSASIHLLQEKSCEQVAQLVLLMSVSVVFTVTIVSWLLL
jgi:hypothetical protein